jgi:iron complex transport system ATP-binding protein
MKKSKLKKESLVKIENLSCGYDKEQVLFDLSFEIHRGEFLGIIGPNASGKTTLLRIITRIMRPWKGRVLYCEREIAEIPKKELAKRIAFLPQLIYIPPSFLVYQFLSLGRLPHIGRFSDMRERDYEAVSYAMEVADIVHLAEKRMSELSGGERQRVLIAQSLSQEPEVLVCDEPTSHLDIGYQVKIMDLLKRLNQNGLTIVSVFHDLNLANLYCTRLILLSSGKIADDGTPNDVMRPERIREIYQTDVAAGREPILERPHIFLIPSQRS